MSSIERKHMLSIAFLLMALLMIGMGVVFKHEELRVAGVMSLIAACLYVFPGSYLRAHDAGSRLENRVTAEVTSICGEKGKLNIFEGSNVFYRCPGEDRDTWHRLSR